MRKLEIFAAVVLVFSLGSSAYAVHYYQGDNGLDPQAWEYGSNWNVGTVPTSSNDAVVGTPGSFAGSPVTTEIEDARECYRLTVGTYGVGTVNIVSGGSLTAYDWTCVLGTGDANGRGRVNVLAGGTLYQSGGGMGMGNYAGAKGILDVAGTATFSSGIGLGAQGRGELYIRDDGVLTATTLTMAANGGGATGGGLVEVSGNGVLNLTGTFTGGEWHGAQPLSWTLRVIDNGSSPDLNVGGNFEVADQGTYEPHIGGNIAFDMYGVLQLRQNLTIEPLAMPGLTDGDYVVMTYAGGWAAGYTEANLNLINSDPLGTWSIKEFSGNQWGTPGQIALTFVAAEAPIPEPATLLLIGTGVLGMIGYARRRQLR